jgi:hypothetical protein
MTRQDLAAEICAGYSLLSIEHRSALLKEGVSMRDLDQFQMCGVALVRVDGELYQPADGRLAIITPVRVHDAFSPESPQPDTGCRLGSIVDVVAWDIRYPDRWALRTGNAEWLGCIEPQYLDPDPVPIRRGVLDWFRAHCTGLVLLSRDPASVYRTLSWCRQGIIAANAEHATELKRTLRAPLKAPRVLVACETV